MAFTIQTHIEYWQSDCTVMFRYKGLFAFMAVARQPDQNQKTISGSIGNLLL